MGKIEKILKKGPVEGQTTEVYPVTSTKAVYDENNKRLDTIITGLQESVYLNNTPIDISFDDTPESNAQNVKNIADYIEKAKAAGVDTTSPFKVFLLLDGYPTEGIYDTYYSCIYSLKITDDGFAYIYTLDGETGKIRQHHEIVTENSEQKVTSSMLDEGARKPIIFTPETTEVDEETYQKLLSDDVDVVFKDASNVFYYIYDIDKKVFDLEIRFVATLGSIDTTDPSDYWFSVAYVDISKNAPHTVTTTSSDHSLQDIFNDLDYLNKSALSPVLQNINLSGTDAERKAKLDQFAKDWKTLTNATDMVGARFACHMTTTTGEGYAILVYDSVDGAYIGVVTDDSYKSYIVHVLESNGSIFAEPVGGNTETDTSMSDTSTNPVQNKVIKAYIDGLVGNVAAQLAQI